MSNFINFHVLISHSPACLNRDDMNMQKDTVFGGKRRVRISSQSLKRAMRKSDYYAEHLGEPSIRTRQLALLADELLIRLNTGEGKKIEKNWIDKAIQVFVSHVVDSEKEDDNTENDDSSSDEISNAGGKKVAVAPWSVTEFRFICEQVKKTFETPLEGKDLDNLNKAIDKEEKRKPTKKNPKKSADEIKEEFLIKKIKSELDEQAEVLKEACGQTLDIALSGRMATSGLMTSVDGAMSVAHAITTHTVDSDIDWFTAVDDLQELGSGHLNTQEFSAGVFYRYASLNLSQLQENIGGADRAKALDIAAHLAHLLATETPNAKQHTFAAFNPADLVMVSFSDFPISLANAFESPVKSKQEGYLKPSIEALNDYWKRVARGYGLTGSTAQFQLSATDVPEGVQALESLEKLKNWIRNNPEV